MEIHYFPMCLYGTLSTWGKLDSELASFRYPTNGPTKIKVVCLRSCQDEGFRAFCNVCSAEAKTGDPRKTRKPSQSKTLTMFSKFRVSKRNAATENEETPGLVLVSTSRISQTSKRCQSHLKLSLILVGPADTA